MAGKIALAANRAKVSWAHRFSPPADTGKGTVFVAGTPPNIFGYLNLIQTFKDWFQE